MLKNLLSLGAALGVATAASAPASPALMKAKAAAPAPPSAAAVGTDICGTLSPQEWKAAYSPYRITGHVRVPANSWLRIEPGVEVRIAPKAAPCADAPKDSGGGLITVAVEGGLYVLGEPGKPVVFRPEAGAGSVGWEGVFLRGTPRDGAEIAFAEFHGANRALRLEHTGFALHHVLFQENNVGLWLGPGSDPLVLHCQFERNRTAGLRLEKSPARVANSLFHRNRGHGVLVAGGGDFTLSHNAFYANGEGDCRRCPYAVLRPAAVNAHGDSVDAFSNLRADPVFEGSESHRLAQAADPDLETPAHLVKDPELAALEKKSRAKAWKSAPRETKPFTRRGEGPYVLSRYSQLVGAGHPAIPLRNPDGTRADIGLHGGPSGRLTRDPF